tara:strand:+ start:3400 stop:3993 length:594 start_codon:yes stop_codon:yes gene_type:complete
MEIKEICNTEVNNVVSIHQNSFKDSFLTNLGDSFLKSYYTILLKNKETTFIGGYIDNELAGFCSVANYSKGYNKRLIKSNIFHFIIIGLKLFVSDPGSIIRLNKNLDKKSSSDDKGDYCEVLSIAVSKKFQGNGLGGKILSFTEKKLKEKKYKNLSLTTDFYNNEATLNFYKKNGYDVLSDFYTYPKRRMYRFIKEF